MTSFPDLRSTVSALVLIADLQILQMRSALIGTSYLSDALLICPGMHKLQGAPDLSKGEYPACAAMTTGYVFRVENEATVFQLQRLGRPGHLTTLNVSRDPRRKDPTRAQTLLPLAFACYSVAGALTLGTMIVLCYLRDGNAIYSLAMLILVRFAGCAIFRGRAKLGWKGAKEPAVQGDLLVLLSQDRWVRIQGLVDDIKTITSGQWLRDMTAMESAINSISILIVYATIASISASSKEGYLAFVVLILGSATLVGLGNHHATSFQMYDRIISPTGPPRAFTRRLDLAKYLIAETGRDDWAIRLGMIQPQSKDLTAESKLGPKIM